MHLPQVNEVISMIGQLRRAHHLSDHAATESSSKDATRGPCQYHDQVFSSDAKRSCKPTCLTDLSSNKCIHSRNLNEQINSIPRQTSTFGTTAWVSIVANNPELSHSRREWMQPCQFGGNLFLSLYVFHEFHLSENLATKNVVLYRLCHWSLLFLFYILLYSKYSKISYSSKL